MTIVEFTSNIFKTFELNERDIYRLWCCVTTKAQNPLHNLERLELWGDSLLSSIFISYCFTRQPLARALDIDGGELVITRCKIKYLSKQQLPKLCDMVGLTDYILCTRNELVPFDKIKEDVVEAWVGACKLIYGYNAIEQYMFGIFDKLYISLDYNELFDAKTRLNDFVAASGGKTMCPRTVQRPSRNGEASLWEASVWATTWPKIVAHGQGSTAKEAETTASENLLKMYKCQLSNFETIRGQIPCYKQLTQFMRIFNSINV